MLKVHLTIKKIENAAAIYLILQMVALVLLQVFFRYVLASPLVWTEELSRLTMIWLVYIGTIIAFRDREHIAVDVLVMNAPKQIKKYIDMINGILIFIFNVTMVFIGYQLAMKQFVSKSAALQIPMPWFTFPIIVATLMMAVRAILFLFYKEDSNRSDTVSIEGASQEGSRC